MLSEFLQNDETALNFNTDIYPLSLNPCEVSFASQFNPLTPAQPPEC
jgi:hypothetical protein